MQRGGAHRVYPVNAQPHKQTFREPWDIWRDLKALPESDLPDPAKAANLLREYARLGERLSRPSLLHSQILRQACRWAATWRDFPAFVKWWDPANLRPEDRQPPAPRPTVGDSPPAAGERRRLTTPPTLVERLAKALCLNLKAFPDPAEAGWAADLLETERRNAPRRSWLPFHRARLLIAAGRPAEARSDMAALVRFKPREFWSWAGLAETFPGNERDARLACLCRAVQCAAKPEYLVQVRQALGLLLLATGRFAEARRELETARDIRIAGQWRIPPALAQALDRPEIQDATMPENNRNLYDRYARKAERLVWTRRKEGEAVQVGGPGKA